MEPRSVSVAILLLATLILALLPSNPADDQSTTAAAKAANHGGGAPPDRILVQLAGRDGASITLALLPHDLYLAGVANGTSHWFAFPGHEHLFPTAAAAGTMSTPTTLPFGNTYRDLIGGLANLPTIPLGREPALDAIAAVSACAVPAAADDDDTVTALKRALATLTVTNCEAARLTPVMEAVGAGWETGDARLAERHLRYIEHWDTISFELVRANRTGVWDGPFTELLKKNAGIRSMEDALAVVGVIANPTLAQVLMAHARSA